MDPTVTVALIGIGGTLLAPVLVHIVELLKLRIEESKEMRRLQLDWLREQNTDRYNRVKDWVIQVMAVLDPAPITWRPDAHLLTIREFTMGELTEQTERLQKLNDQAAEVGLFASGDEQLAQHLQDFINTMNSLGEGREPDKIEEARSAAAKVVNRAYKLMLQVPKS
jgi:hypothetical protein